MVHRGALTGPLCFTHTGGLTMVHALTVVSLAGVLFALLAGGLVQLATLRSTNQLAD